MIWELIVCIGIGFNSCTVTASFPNAEACYIASQRIKYPLNTDKHSYCKPAGEKVENV